RIVTPPPPVIIAPSGPGSRTRRWLPKVRHEHIRPTAARRRPGVPPLRPAPAPGAVRHTGGPHRQARRLLTYRSHHPHRPRDYLANQNGPSDRGHRPGRLAVARTPRPPEAPRPRRTLRHAALRTRPVLSDQ